MAQIQAPGVHGTTVMNTPTSKKQTVRIDIAIRYERVRLRRSSARDGGRLEIECTCPGVWRAMSESLRPVRMADPPHRCPAVPSAQCSVGGVYVPSAHGVH